MSARRLQTYGDAAVGAGTTVDARDSADVGGRRDLSLERSPDRSGAAAAHAEGKLDSLPVVVPNQCPGHDYKPCPGYRADRPRRRDGHPLHRLMVLVGSVHGK